IASRVDRDPMTVSVIWNRWHQDGNSHITSPKSRVGMVYKITSICTNSSATLAAAQTLSSETMVTTNLDSASQTGASSMV
ncbi:hypothetical protein TNCV_4327291, partial [Trichonephila clavipes]